MPRRTGKLKNLSKFDPDFFGITGKQADEMDVRQRLLLEVSFEALYDAGFNPKTLRGSKTGVFVGATGTESFSVAVNNSLKPENYSFVGHATAILANRISYTFDLQGPSLTIDTACSSGLTCLQRAFISIASGESNSAIVASSNIFCEPKLSQVIGDYGMLSPDGACKAFDDNGNGYVRSEAVVVLFICRAAEAKRIYASILHAKSNADGFMDGGINRPSVKGQEQLLRETYAEANVNPLDVSYVEAHGTGTQIGDATELAAVYKVLCQNRPLDKPLLIGSIKSNMGHSEPASGLCSIVKLILSHCYGTLPANLHYNNPNRTLRDFSSKEGGGGPLLKVVHENIPWPGDVVGVSSFGFGAANTHAILRFFNPQSSSWMIDDKALSYCLDPPPPLGSLLVPLVTRTMEMMEGLMVRFQNSRAPRDEAALMINLNAQRIPGYLVFSGPEFGSSPTVITDSPFDVTGSWRNSQNVTRKRPKNDDESAVTG